MKKLGFAQAALSLFLISCGESMSDEKGPLNLSNGHYWENPLDHTGSIGLDRLSEGLEGMIIDAPRMVYLDERKTIPLVCLRTQSKEKAQWASLASTAQLVVSHLETGSVQVVKLARSPDIRDSRAPSKGWINEWHVADIRSLANLGPNLGHYKAWLVCGAEASNQVAFQVYSKKGDEKSKAVQEKLRSINHHVSEKQTTGNAPDVSVAEEINPGKEASYWRLSVIPGSENEVRFRLDYKVTGLPGYLYAEGHQKTDKEGNRIFAAIPLVLLGFDRSHGLLYQAGLSVPVFRAPSGEIEKPVLEGGIILTLKQGRQMNSLNGLSTLWAISGADRASAQTN